jgi:hypothetical protein
LRKVCGLKCEKGIWKIRSYLELQKAFKSPDIVTQKLDAWNGWITS